MEYKSNNMVAHIEGALEAIYALNMHLLLSPQLIGRALHSFLPSYRASSSTDIYGGNI